LDLIPQAQAAGVSCIAVTGYPLEAKEASDQLIGCMPKPVSGEQIAELVNWFEDSCTGSTEKPPSTFMFFAGVLPPLTVQTRAFLERRRARPNAMPKRLRRSLS
jgi:hypothetical protein